MAVAVAVVVVGIVYIMGPQQFIVYTLMVIIIVTIPLQVIIIIIIIPTPKIQK